MICNYFRVIHITIGKIITGNTQPALNVAKTSSGGPLYVGLGPRPTRALHGTPGGPIQKLMILQKMCF